MFFSIFFNDILSILKSCLLCTYFNWSFVGQRALSFSIELDFWHLLASSGIWHCRFRIAQLRHEARAVAKEATAPQPPPPPAVPPVPPAAPEEAPEAPEVTVAAKEPEMPQELRASGHVWVAMGGSTALIQGISRHFTSFYADYAFLLQIAVQMAFLSLHFCRDLERGAYHWCCKRSVYRGFAVDQENSMNWYELAWIACPFPRCFFRCRKSVHLDLSDARPLGQTENRHGDWPVSHSNLCFANLWSAWNRWTLVSSSACDLQFQRLLPRSPKGRGRRVGSPWQSAEKLEKCLGKHTDQDEKRSDRERQGVGGDDWKTWWGLLRHIYFISRSQIHPGMKNFLKTKMWISHMPRTVEGTTWVSSIPRGICHHTLNQG